LPAACGGGAGSAAEATATTTGGADASSETPLTAAQANVLAGVLYANQQAGGASFRATVPFGSAATFVLEGTIDWRNHVGQATVVTRFSSGQPEQRVPLLFTQTAVLDGSIRDHAEQLAPLGLDQLKWVARAPAPGDVPLDVVLALLMGMASEQRENPLLIRQSGAAFLRSDEVGGVAVDVYRYGERTRYWVAEDGVIRRVEAELAVAEGTTIIDLSPGPQQVLLPNENEVTSLDRLPPEIQDLLARR
jgi:hypothetical protein